MLAIDSKGLLPLGRRELPLDRIADVVIEEIRGRGGPSYYIYYVTAEGERIERSEFYDGSKDFLTHSSSIPPPANSWDSPMRRPPWTHPSRASRKVISCNRGEFYFDTNTRKY